MAATIVWFRNDLRLADNPALHAAARSGDAVVPVFILDDEAPAKWRLGGASRWWLDGSLAALQESLGHIGSRLILARGPTRELLWRIARDVDATSFYCTRAYESWAIELEHGAKNDCDREGIEFKRFNGALLFEPEAIATKAGEPFKVYTPFARAAFAKGGLGKNVPAPKQLIAPARWPSSEKLADWDLRPAKPDWSGGLKTNWTPGERAARTTLATFIESDLADYHNRRDQPGVHGTSRLSPYLHHGEISPRQCWQSVRTAADADLSSARGAEAFLKEILWREFSHHLLFHFPKLPDEPYRAPFKGFPWSYACKPLKSWKTGMTGYPIVDAGMRELWTTGWMHNRVRMIVASFLVKDLMIPWQTGEAWFWDTLVDANLANNAMNWQWVAGCGVDAAPYFRIFNPVTQGRKFDPKGDYVGKWCPELARLPAQDIHSPWEADSATLAAAGVRLGEDYPHPIIDHAKARARALAAFNALNER